MSPTYLYMNNQLVSSKLPGIHKVCSIGQSNAAVTQC